MAYLDNRVYDNGLSVLDLEANRVDITSAEASTYAEATSTLTLGNTTNITVGAPQDATAGGREVILSAITDGTITGTGTATHYAIVDTVNNRLLAAGSLTAPQAVTSGNTFTTTAASIRIPAPA